MNISAINNVQFTGRVTTPGTLKKGSNTVCILGNSLIDSHKNGYYYKELRFDKWPMEEHGYCNFTEVRNLFNGLRARIWNESDRFHRMDLDFRGTYIGDFTIHKNSKGEIDTVSFYDPISRKSEVTVRDSKDLEALRAAFKNYNDNIKRFENSERAPKLKTNM